MNDVPSHNFFVRAKLAEWLPLFLLLLIAIIWLYRTPYSASNLEVPPDTVEYALAPLEFLETGAYNIRAAGISQLDDNAFLASPSGAQSTAAINDAIKTAVEMSARIISELCRRPGAA